MLNRRQLLTLLMLAAAAVAAPSAFAKGKGKTPKTGKVEGTLAAVASNGVSIQTAGGVLVSVGVTSATKVELNDRHVPVTSLPIGARAEAVFNPTTLIASKVEATQ